jgi:hypothetical protein
VLLGHPLATGVAAHEGVHAHACGSLVVCARLDRASARALPRSGLHGALPRPRPPPPPSRPEAVAAWMAMRR